MEYILLIWLIAAIIVAVQRHLKDLEKYYDSIKDENDRYYDEIDYEFENNAIII